MLDGRRPEFGDIQHDEDDLCGVAPVPANWARIEAVPMPEQRIKSKIGRKALFEERKARNEKFSPSASKAEDRREKTRDGDVRRGSLMPSPVRLNKKDEKKRAKVSPSSGSNGVQRLHASVASTPSGNVSKGSSSFSLERQPSLSDGLTMEEFFDTNAARWNVPKGDLTAFVKEYMMRLVNS